MPSRLDQIKNWEELAARCGYSPKRLARECNVSMRQLRRYFQEQFGVSPKPWSDNLRLRGATEHLRKGTPVKAVSAELDFKQPSHFTKFVKRLAWTTPREYRAHGRNG